MPALPPLCALTFALTMAAVAPAVASDIYKCVDGNAAVSYQAAPCVRGQIESRLLVARPQVEVTPSAGAVAPLQRRPGPWRNVTLVLGMSDDEVLNLPAWGKPTRIVRTRLPREWREVWTYGQPVPGPRELHFVNARLAEIVEPARTPIARLTLQ
jgi:hypothetical protein